MTKIGYATLDVIPSFRNFGRNLQTGTAPIFGRVGKQGGAQFVDGVKSGLAALPRTVDGAISTASKEFKALPAEMQAAVQQTNARARGILADAQSAVGGNVNAAGKEMLTLADAMKQAVAETNAQANRILADSRRGVSANARQAASGMAEPFRRAGEEAGKEAEGGLLGALKGLKEKSAEQAAAAGLGFGLAFNEALDAGAAQDKLAAQLGATPAQAARYGKIAADVYSGAWGDSLEQVNEAINGVVKNVSGMGNASKADLEGVTARVLDLSTAFDQDLGGTTAAIGQMIRTGLVANTQEALDTLTVGLQSNANKADDLLDTFNEYGTQFRKLGLNGADAMGLLSQALENGARDSDVAADALKEFSIRSLEPLYATAADGTQKLTPLGLAFEDVGVNADKAQAMIAKGGPDAKAALSDILNGLSGIADPTLKAQAAVALFGTQAEDLGGALFSMNLDKIGPQFRDVGGAADEMSQTLNDNAQARLTEFIRTLKTDMVNGLGAVVPAFDGIVSGAEDAAGAFSALPGPVKAAAGAFVALRVAALTSLSTTATTGVASMGSALVGLRIRAMLAADAFRQARAGTLLLSGNTGRFTAPVGRMSASLTGLKAAAQGAGAGLRSGLGGAMGLLGGPWGVAILAATAGVTYFWQEHQKAKQFVDDLSGSLNNQTGALTSNTREIIANKLAQSGWLDYADKLGLDLETVRKAALGNADALAEIKTQVDAQKGSRLNPFNSENWTEDSGQFIQALQDSAAAVSDAKDQQKLHNKFLGEGKDATNDVADANLTAKDSFKSMADQIADAKDKIKELADEENKRRLANLADRQDKLALIQQMQATKAEATNAPEVKDINKQISDAQRAGAKERADLRKQLDDKGADKGGIKKEITQSWRDQSAAVADLRDRLKEYKATLDPATKAGQENLTSLYDLADQWNNSAGAVTQAKGAYKEIRKTFIDSAETMGATKKQAKNLADQILKVPPRKKIAITTPGMRQAQADLEALRQMVKDSQDLAVRVNVHNNARLDRMGNTAKFARGGKVGGYGIGDKQLILADSREWVINPRAVNYYGDGLMDAINRMRLPRFAQGGPVAATRPTSVSAGSTYNVTVVADDPWAWKRDMEHMARVEAMNL